MSGKSRETSDPQTRVQLVGVDGSSENDPRPKTDASPPTTDDPRPTTHGPRSTVHDPTAHAHAHANAHDEQTDGQVAGAFPHEKLDAYQVALKMVALANKLADEIPRGHRSIADHLLRASSNTVLLLAEGANRRGAGQKRQRFVESRGECGEVGAAADLLVVLNMGAVADAEQLKRLASRVSAMLTRLIARLGDGP
jgi:four helix bundle protein